MPGFGDQPLEGRPAAPPCATAPRGAHPTAATPPADALGRVQGDVVTAPQDDAHGLGWPSWQWERSPCPTDRSSSSTSTGPTWPHSTCSRREILAAVEEALRLQGLGRTVLEPRTHLRPIGVNGHFNVLRGAAARAWPGRGQGGRRLRRQLRRGLPSEMALLLLLDPRDRDAARARRRHGDHRHAHRRADRDRRPAPRRGGIPVLGHVGARGTAWWNVRLLDQPVRLRRDPRAFAPAGEPRRLRRRLGADIGKPVRRAGLAALPGQGADIMVEASGWSGPSRCCRRRGSSRVRWSFPTAP